MVNNTCNFQIESVSSQGQAFDSSDEDRNRNNNMIPKATLNARHWYGSLGYNQNGIFGSSTIRSSSKGRIYAICTFILGALIMMAILYAPYPSKNSAAIVNSNSVIPKEVDDADHDDTPMSGNMKLVSTAFQNDEMIPSKYSGTLSPPLQWSGVPSKSRSLLLIVNDPDAPDPENPQTVWVHWIVYGISPQITNFEEGIHPLPGGCQQGANDWNRLRYDGPSPPIGKHRYFFKLYALDVDELNIPNDDDSKKDFHNIYNAMKNHIIDHAVLMGTYEK